MTAKDFTANRFKPEGFLEVSDLSTHKPKSMTPVVGKAIRFDSRTHEVIVEFTNGILGIIPEDEFSIYDFTYSSNCIVPVPHQISSLIGRKVRAFVLGEMENGMFLLSRKRSMLEAWKSIKNGDILQAQIINIIHCGVFIDIGSGITSYVPLTECSATRIFNPKKWFNLGEHIRVQISNKQPLYRIDASIKQAYLTLEELTDLDQIFEGDVIAVKLSQQLPGGYFCEYTPNIVGIVDVFYDSFLSECKTISASVHKITPKGLKLRQLF